MREEDRLRIFIFFCTSSHFHFSNDDEKIVELILVLLQDLLIP